MLELKGIKKDYLAGENTVHALKGIDLRFRSSEFVSILGPSGCGKTTMLNIIGGLDKYSEGDLIINGISTKSYKDKDWDTYRNHSIGFVFQSYNLIPHQSVLQNVEIALTLSGVKKSERRERAKKALEDVGLGNQLHKKPSEMSGGQMQRVAIARALVNNPDIILADEPTGALDTETSVQVMEILKNISKDRLIIMVTHNPELAEQYSSRIIRMLDGEIKDDSKPLTDDEIKAEAEHDKTAQEAEKKKKKPSMSFATSFGLSLKNLFTKKGRTMLTSFAGSIGIIGIALVLSISQGFQAYIDLVQEETLSSYPLTIESATIDMTTLMETFMGVEADDVAHENDAVYEKAAIYSMVEAMNNLEATENDLRAFKEYIENQRNDEESKLAQALNGVQYSYNLDLLVYTKNVDGTIIQSDTAALLQDLMSEAMDIDMGAMFEMEASMMGGTSSMDMMAGGLWQEMLPGEDGDPINDLLEKQYDVVYGSWPSDYDEVVLVLDDNNELDDVTLYALGLNSKETMDEIMDAAVNKTKLDSREESSWSYEEICDMEYRVILNSECWSYDELTDTYTDLRETESGLKFLYDNGLTLKVSGIIRPNEEASTTMLTGAIAYTHDLTEYIIEEAKDSEAIAAQLEDETTDIFTGLPFREVTGEMTDEEKETEFRNYIDNLDNQEKAMVYVQMMCIPSAEQLEASVAQAMQGQTRETMEQTMIQALTQQMGMSEAELEGYIKDMDDEDLEEAYTMMVEEQVKMQYAAQVTEQMAQLPAEQKIAGLKQLMDSSDTAALAQYHDDIMVFSDSDYETNLIKLGYLDLDEPSAINLYASSFENKDVIEEVIADYNEDVEELSQIKYTDYVGLMMSSITTIINTITYVLISFVAISLIVSSIMIGVITLISVQERTKEIGILRAIGASKRDVSSMFNAETLIIGFTSGLLGVVVTYLLCIPINAVIHALTGILALNAVLPIGAAVILVIISMVLTLIAGVIPSRSAAKKDPVVALRTE
ncbi:MAG: ABC transporter ATP-binding protein/permease [Oscillospiraceae bacterium]|nr:ABC transporter ATP-binding protein/permease [Oscillospiraceae bacterium]